MPAKPKHKPPPAESDEEELALALVLWMRCRSTLRGEKYLPDHKDESLYNKAFALAEKFGVKKEFLAMLLSMDVLRVTVKNVDK